MNTTAKVIQVIRLETTEGEGEELNPYRRVIRYFSLDGEHLAKYDKWGEQPCSKGKKDDAA